ncbi:MAG: hypothetical protein K2J72_07430, partial [Oscillospiraceae bacterium]|nr:hypothetical protein [Oscillospiraceae bacterium]
MYINEKIKLVIKCAFILSEQCYNYTCEKIKTSEKEKRNRRENMSGADIVLIAIQAFGGVA